jgi:thiamine biosynthesis lipoprotein
MPAVIRNLRAMGTDCSVICYAPADIGQLLADAAEARIELLEDCWSRFRAHSELNRLNHRAGTGPVQCSADLVRLVATMRAAWEMTGGLFDPTILPSIKAAGYDADFATVIARGAIAASSASLVVERAPGLERVIVDEVLGTVDLPAGIGIDPGAIGKGLAADIIVDELMGAGADGVLVNLGGDVVFAGAPGDDPAWVLAIEDERVAIDHPDRVIRHLEFEPGITRGAVATSTTLKRVWGNGRHHLIDPRTGDIARGDLVQATVVDDMGWRAEAAATAALLMGAGRAAEWLSEHDLVSVLLTSEQLLTDDTRIGDTSD